ncbi:disulfide-isomerase-like protein [Drosera capensis]
MMVVSKKSILVVISLLVPVSFLGISAAPKKKGGKIKFEDESEFVLTLTKSNFSDTVSKHKFVVVEFYAPWCSYHKILTPEYEKAASILSSHDPPIVLAKVDTTKKKNNKLAAKYGISDIDSQLQPVLKILRKRGKVVQDYKGPRDANGIVAHLKKQADPASILIMTYTETKAVFGGHDVVVVGLFTNFAREEFQNFISVAEKLQPEFRFAHTWNATLLPRGEPPVKMPIVRLFKPFDEPFVDFEDFHIDALENFIREASSPPVTILTKDNTNDPSIVQIFTSEDVKVILLLDMADKGSNTYKAKYDEIAKSYKGKGMRFLISDVEDSYGMVKFLGADKNQAPLLALESGDRKKYVKPIRAPDDIATCIQEYEGGNLVPYEDTETNQVAKDEL